MSCFRVLDKSSGWSADKNVQTMKRKALRMALDEQVRTLSVQRYYAALTTSVMDVMRSLQFVSPSLNRIAQKVVGRFQQNFLG